MMLDEPNKNHLSNIELESSVKVQEPGSGKTYPSVALDFHFSFAAKNKPNKRLLDKEQGGEFVLSPKLISYSNRIAILGPSGSGKSLTLNAIAGLIKPGRGYINVLGNKLFDSQLAIDVASHQRRVAYVFQDYALFPHLTIKQNIGFGLVKSYLNYSKNNSLPAAAMHWVQAFGLENLLGRYPYQLSGGQAQRVALARALAIKPKILLLDEPLSALDNDLRAKMRMDLLDLQAKINIPMILITHDADEANLLADDIFHIANGIIL